MEIKDQAAIAAVAVSFLGILATVMMAFRNSAATRKREREVQAREDKLRVIERAYVPRTEFDLECRFFGPEPGPTEPMYICEIRLIAHNKGSARRKFESIQLRLLGIERGATLGFWGEEPKRLKFTETDYLKDDFVPPPPPEKPDDKNYYYVEPSVRQNFTYITMVPARWAYARLHVKCRAMIGSDTIGEHTDDRVFTEERLFPVEPVTSHRATLPRGSAAMEGRSPST